MGIAIASVLTIYVGLLAIISRHVNTKVPEPYMDEIFHIPQAQRYCAGDYYTWDPKLTTPPGLYIVSNIILLLTRLLSGSSSLGTLGLLCTTQNLRAVNLSFSVALFLVLIRLLKNLQPKATELKCSITALILSLFPVGFFYNFLYYTDSGSTLFVLWAYSSVRQKRYWIAGVLSGISVMFRQTNIIWTCFLLGISIIQLLYSSSGKNQPAKNLHNPKVSEMYTPLELISTFLTLINLMFSRLPTLLWNLTPLLLNIIGFVWFLVWNGSVVLGDKNNHIASLHFPQLFYFSGFASFFAAPFLISTSTLKRLASGTLGITIGRFVFLISVVLVMAYLVRKYTVEHPFLLADNRHYAFYVWKNIYRRHAFARYAVIPAYVLCSWLCLINIAHQTVLFYFIYIATLFLSLIPSPLLEPRYFILPFLMYVLHLREQTFARLVITLVLYILINVFTGWMFLEMGFEWVSEPGRVQRFMW